MRPRSSSSRARAVVAVLAVVAAVVAVACGDDDGAGSPVATDQVPQAADDAPNVVVIMTDDQTLESMRVMTRTNELLGEAGTTFTQSLVSFPLCCPSRVTFLTGQYAHNHGNVGNLPPDGGYSQLDHRNTLAMWLQRAGYHTSHVGHYLYGYGGGTPREIPPGWDRWFSTVDPSTFNYFDYTVNDNGEITAYDDRDEHYQSDVFTDRAVAEIERLAPEEDPFFLDVWYLAPHVERPEENVGGFTEVTAVPAPRHAGAMAGEAWPRTPSFNEPDVADKPGYIAQRGQFNPVTQIEIQNHYRAALESLLAVDEAVERLVAALEAAGELDETLIVFTSDNGLLEGEHRLRDVKVVPYEEALLVPLLVRGPGFPAGAEVDAPVVNADVTATILDAAGIAPGLEADGLPLAPIAGDPAGAADRAIFVENGPQSGQYPHFEGVRVDGYSYVEYESGVVELYDLAADPFQLDNAAGDPAYAAIEATLADLLAELRGCAGEACHTPRFTPPG